MQKGSITHREPGTSNARINVFGRFSRTDLAFFLIAFFFLYTQLFQFPFTPYYFEGDHLLPVSNAIRVVQGEVMYRDFFHLTPPGTELFYAAFFSVFGVRIWILNFSILLLGMGLTGMAWFYSRSLFEGLIAYLAPSIFLIVGFRLYFIDGSYRLFSVIFVLIAVATLFSGRHHVNYAIAGVSCAAASFFVQPRGVMGLAGIVLFLLWEHFRSSNGLGKILKPIALVLGSFVAATLILHSYFLYNAGSDNYFFSLVTFLRDHYPSDPLSNRNAFLADVPSLRYYLELYGAPAAISRYLRVAGPALFFYALIPYVYIVFLLYRWRSRSYLEDRSVDRKLMLLCFVGLALSAGVSAPSVFRLAHVSIPGLIIFVWLVTRFTSKKMVYGGLLVLLGLVGVSYVVQRQTVAKDFLEMPAGTAAFLSSRTFDRYKWVSDNTKPGDLFFEGHHPSFYFPFHLKNPTPLYLLRDSDYTPDFQVNSVVASLRSQPPEIILWPRKWSRSAGERGPGDHLQPLWNFVQDNYRYELEFARPVEYTPYSEGDIEVWRRK